MVLGSDYVYTDDGVCLTRDASNNSDRVECEVGGGIWNETWGEGFCTEVWLQLSSEQTD